MPKVRKTLRAKRSPAYPATGMREALTRWLRQHPDRVMRPFGDIAFALPKERKP